jgi:predicted CXXCH cytochrome family protein
MKSWKSTTVRLGILFVILAVFGCTATQLGQPPQKVDLSGAAYVGSNACAQCHEKEAKGYAQTSHATSLKPLSAYGLKLPPKIKVFDDADKDGKNSVVEIDLTSNWVHGVMSNHYVLATIPKEVGFEGGTIYRVAGVAKKGDAWELKPAASRDVDKDGKPDWVASVVNMGPDYICSLCHSPGLNEMVNKPTKRPGAEKMEKGIGCETCHGPGSLHVEDKKANTILSGKASCAVCHKDGRPNEGKDGKPWTYDSGNHYGVRNWFANNHLLRGKMTCGDCHTSHSVNAGGKMLPGTVEQTCARCHNYKFNIEELMWKTPTDRMDHITRDHGFGFLTYNELGDDPKTKNTEITNPAVIEKIRKVMK